jgi:hypothetical protein
MKRPTRGPLAKSKSKKSKPGGFESPEQSEWLFGELENMSAMPRCEVTGVNVDLHLVAYRDPDSNEFTARLLGADYRHLVRHKTTLSIPVAVLSTVVLRQLEKMRKIPLGTRAAKQLREWFGRDSEAEWGENRKRKSLRQAPLDLPEDADQPLFQLV